MHPRGRLLARFALAGILLFQGLAYVHAPAVQAPTAGFRRVPRAWCVLPAPPGWKLGALGPDPVFRHYLLGLGEDREPAPGERIAWDATTELVWEERTADEGGRVAGAWMLAHTRVESDRERACMARLSGAATLFVNGEPFLGDLYERGIDGVPIALLEGRNELFVVGSRAGFGLELYEPPSRIVVGEWGVEPPDLVIGEDNMSFFHSVELMTYNVSLAPASTVHMHYGKLASRCADPVSQWTEWMDGHGLPPLGMRSYSVYVGTSDWGPITGPPGTIGMAIAYGVAEPLTERILSLPVRASGEAPFVSEIARVRSEGLAFAEAPAVRDQNMVRATPLPANAFGRVFAEPYVLVHGTGGRMSDGLALHARARYDQSVAWYRSGTWPELLSDADFLLAEPTWYADKNVILYGNADTNLAWNRVVPAGSAICPHDGVIVSGERRFEGGDLACLFVSPRADQQGSAKKLVGVFGDSGRLGIRLGLAWQPFVSGLHYPDGVAVSSDSLLPDGRWLAGGE